MLSILCTMLLLLFNLLTASRLANTFQLQKASTSLGIHPPWNAPSWIWRTAWKVSDSLLPYLHYFDECKAGESFVNLSVLWWKAISGNRLGSRTYDGGFAYDMLPSFSRNIVSFPFCYLYPDLHHQNVALRTAFLDESLSSLLNQILSKKPTTQDIQVITFGAGFDTRSLRYLNDEKKVYQSLLKEQNATISFHEIDLPSVIEQKKKVLERFSRRRTRSSTMGPSLPYLHTADMNNIQDCHFVLSHSIPNSLTGENGKSSKSATMIRIFIFEAVLLYLPAEKSESVLQLLSSTYHDGDTYMIFADRLPQVPVPAFVYANSTSSSIPIEEQELQAQQELQDVERILGKYKWQLLSWLPKPGKARHMGIAQLQ